MHYYFLLQEDGSYILQEDGASKLIIGSGSIYPFTGSMPFSLGLTSETTIYQNEVKCRVLENDFNYSLIFFFFFLLFP